MAACLGFADAELTKLFFLGRLIIYFLPGVLLIDHLDHLRI